MEDLKHPMRNLIVSSAILLVFGQLSTTSPQEQYPTFSCAWDIESVMDPQENHRSANITLENVRSSELCKEYFSVINLIRKVESSKSTKMLLNSCLECQIIPKTDKASTKNLKHSGMKTSSIFFPFLFGTEDIIIISLFLCDYCGNRNHWIRNI